MPAGQLRELIQGLLQLHGVIPLRVHWERNRLPCPSLSVSVEVRVGRSLLAAEPEHGGLSIELFCI